MGSAKRKLKTRETDAFDLGWDHGIYGVAPNPQLPAPVREGYLAARDSRNRHGADRFVIKWLQIRSNAMLRGIPFDAAMTPDTIRSLDLECCPVSGVPLTHGERGDADWSVDRVLNKHGYRPGNLLVVSTRVNLAKGSLSPTKIRSLASRGEAHRGLEPSEWQTLSAIVHQFELAEKNDPPAGYPRLAGESIAKGLRLSPIAFWQYAVTLALASGDDDFVAAVLSNLPRTKPVRRAMVKLARELKTRFRKTPEPLCAWSSRRVQKRLDSLIEMLPESWNEEQARRSEQYFSSNLGLVYERQRLRRMEAMV
ncbi:MAG: hypothetical protein ACREVN_08800 [Gammaproteobacteria bacterium]